MKLTLTHQNVEYGIGANPIDLAVPMIFNGDQPNTYGVPKATSEAFDGGGFVGDVRQGGSCNFETYQLTPHCNGTHTEGIGHIARERISVHPILKDSFFPATLISVQPVSPVQTADTYRPAANPEDLMITRKSLQDAIGEEQEGWLEALVIRTLPNDSSKLSRDYTEVSPPFFSLEAMQYIRSLGVKHLLVDLPSVDRMHDEGHLDNHHEFWSVEKDSHEIPVSDAIERTITEMIYAAPDVEDDIYLLEIQVAPWMSDAAPSRPRLFEVEVATWRQ